MADNIFDAQRDRRIQNLQQQSVSNLVKANPNLRGVLTRYEDAEVSRIKLLELQQMRSKKITAGEKALLATLRKGRRARGARQNKGGPRQDKQKKDQELAKSQTQIEVEAEEKRAKVKQEEKKLRQQDRFLELEDFKQQREFRTAAQDRDQRELQRQTGFISGQNRIAADAQIAQFNSQQAQLRNDATNARALADRQEQSRLEDRRLNLQRAEIDARQIRDRKQRGLEHRRINTDVDRYNADVRRAELERDGRIVESENQLRGVQERVARDDAFRHAQLQETQRLALAQLASQQQDNEFRHRLEQNRIDNQRAVDAERAITDREKEQTLTSALDALRHQQVPATLPTGRGVVEDARSASGSSSDAGAPDIAGTLRGLDESLAEVNEAGELRLEEDNSSLSSGAEDLARSPSVVQRAAAIQGSREFPRAVSPRARREGSTTPPPRSTTPERTPLVAAARAAARGTGRGQGQSGLRSPSPEQPVLRLNPAPRSQTSGSSSPSVIGEYGSDTPIQQPTGLEQAVGAVGTGLGAAGRLAGGAVGGVAQGIFEQLPAASDVGAAVGRGGVRALSGVAGAIYEGLAGEEAEPEPTPRIGGGGQQIYETLRRQAQSRGDGD